MVCGKCNFREANKFVNTELRLGRISLVSFKRAVMYPRISKLIVPKRLESFTSRGLHKYIGPQNAKINRNEK